MLFEKKWSKLESVEQINHKQKENMKKQTGKVEIKGEYEVIRLTRQKVQAESF